MNVKEAVSTAKASVAELFADQLVSEPLLEEVECDHEKNVWRITIGFLRMPEHLQSGPAAARAPGAPVFGQFYTPRRTYKVVSIDGETSRVISVKDRELQ